ncbi:4730_t:CDS:2 [Funneliformis geosporum]|nr:4730_t:CDS:2 [Funneliformis geosporum]
MQTNATYAYMASYEQNESRSPQTSINLSMPNSLDHTYDPVIMSGYFFIENAFFIFNELLLLLPLPIETVAKLLEDIVDGNQNVNLFYYVHPFTNNVTLFFQCEQHQQEIYNLETQPFSCFTFQNDYNHQVFDSRKDKCKWKKENVNALLSYLKKHKEEVRQLESRGVTAGKIKNNLWKNAFTALSEEGYIYTADQCAIKWKNIKQNHYKDEFKEIICEKRMSKRKLEHEFVNEEYGQKKSRKVKNRKGTKEHYK